MLLTECLGPRCFLQYPKKGGAPDIIDFSGCGGSDEFFRLPIRNSSRNTDVAYTDKLSLKISGIDLIKIYCCEMAQHSTVAS